MLLTRLVLLTAHECRLSSEAGLKSGVGYAVLPLQKFFGLKDGAILTTV